MYNFGRNSIVIYLFVVIIFLQNFIFKIIFLYLDLVKYVEYN